MTLDQDARGQGHDGQADFDFLIGSWRVRNRRVRRPRAGWDSWEEFEGTLVAEHIWGGQGNIDRFEADTESGPVRGLTLRLYDPQARQWNLYWTDPGQGTLGRPQVGEFRNGRGDFYDQDRVEGRTVFVRYVWSDITATSCRWEQAFSWDGGATWTVDWVMEYTRI
jgi:hypothetical protein